MQDLLRLSRGVLRLSQQTGGAVHEATQRHDPLPDQTVSDGVSEGPHFQYLLQLLKAHNYYQQMLSSGRFKFNIKLIR